MDNNVTPFDIVNSANLSDDTNPEFPALAPVSGYEAYAANTAPLSPTGAGWDPEIAQRVEALPELPDEVKAAMEKGPSDMDLLHIRLNDLEELIRKNHEENGVAFKFLCDSMTWLTTMLSGVAQMAQNMPGMGGMMKAMLKGGK